jgi:hypothetical protein
VLDDFYNILGKIIIEVTANTQALLCLHSGFSFLDVVNALHFPSVKTFEWDSSQVSHMKTCPSICTLFLVLLPYQSVRMNTLHKYPFHRQQSVRNGEFSVLFNHKLNTFLLGLDMLRTK